MGTLRSLALLSFAALVAMAAVLLWLRPSAPPAHRVFLNGTVLTMDAADRVAEAVSVRHDHIDAVGSNDEVRRSITSGTVVVDLGGRTLMPGFIDAHGHFPGSGMREIVASLESPPVGSVRAIADIQEALRRRLAAGLSGDWLIGIGYDDSLLTEKRHPTRADLDAVSAEVPIIAMHVSIHMGVGNGAALAALGIDRTTPDPPGGVIDRDPQSGEPTGLLQETAFAPAQNLLFAGSLRDRIAIMRRATADYAAAGVTTAQAGAVGVGAIRSLSWASWLGLIPMRLVVWPEHARAGAAVLAGKLDRDAHRTDLFEIGALKIIADGSIQGYTGYLGAPYHTPHRGDATYRGYPAIGRDELREAVRAYHLAGWQVAVHGNGDAAIDEILDAVAAAQAARPDPDARTILVHAQMARDDQLERMKRLSVTPSFFSAHTYYWGDRHRDVFLGAERARHISPTRSAASRGLRFSVHLDTPVVPMDPLLLVWSTVNRVSTGGQVIGAEQRLAPTEALRAVTIDAAWQLRHEGDRGSIEPGKLADLVVLSADPRADPAAIRDVRVLETIVGGRTIHAVPAAPEGATS